MTSAASRPFRLRLLGVLLAAYGAVGLLVVAGGAVLVTTAVPSLDGLVRALDTQRQVVVRSLDATGTFLSDARTGTGNVGTSLTATVESAREAAGLTRSLATAMDQLSAASAISIFGNQPFAAAGSTLAQVSQQADSLAASLDQTAGALAANKEDLDRVHDDLAAVATEIGSLRAQLAAASLDSGAAAPVTQAIGSTRLVVLALLAWLAFQALVAIAVGVALIRWRPVVVVPERVAVVEADPLP